VGLNDRDDDGILDKDDKEPNKFNTTKANKGKPVGQGNSPDFKADIPSITLPGIDPKRGVDTPEAKNWFKFAKKAGGVRQKTYEQFVAELGRMGIPKSKAQKVWDDAVDWTQTIGSGSTGIPMEYLRVLDPSDYTDKDSSTSKYGTTKTIQSTTTQYSKSKAAQDINQTFKEELGMTATAADIEAYTKAANIAAAKEPSVYTGVTTTSPGKGMDVVTTAATSTTGFDPNIFAENFARSNPLYAEAFAAKNFLGLIEGLLKDPNAIGRVVE
jgi:hypothetical protein